MSNRRLSLLLLSMAHAVRSLWLSVSCAIVRCPRQLSVQSRLCSLFVVARCGAGFRHEAQLSAATARHHDALAAAVESAREAGMEQASDEFAEVLLRHAQVMIAAV